MTQTAFLPYTQRWVRNKLRANATLYAAVGGRVYAHIAPQNVSRPWIILDAFDAEDLMVVGAEIIMAHVRFDVKVVGRAVDNDPSFETMKDIMVLVDDTLHQATGTDANIAVLMCVRFSTLNYTDDHGFEHLVSRYYAEVQKA